MTNLSDLKQIYGIRTVQPSKDTGGRWLAVLSLKSPWSQYFTSPLDEHDIAQYGDTEDDAVRRVASNILAMSARSIGETSNVGSREP